MPEEESKQSVSPLWELETAGRNQYRLSKHVPELETRLRWLKQYSGESQRRNKNRKTAGTELDRVRQSLAEERIALEKAAERLRDCLDKAEHLMMTMDPREIDRRRPLLGVWKRVKWKKMGDQFARVFPWSRGVKACPSCHLALPTQFAEFLADPTKITICPKCQVILAAGDTRANHVG